MKNANEKIAVFLPCYNEEKTIYDTVKDFQRYLPEAMIIVLDNNSTDRTAEEALKAGAVVVNSPKQGKGYVIRQMFRGVKADICIVADGDYTYPACYAPKLADGIRNGYDMMIGDRLSKNYYADNKRFGHNFGNWLVCFLINIIYKANVADVMTGYRAFSKNFVKNISLESKGFEVETEMTIKAIKNGMSIGAIPIQYRERPEGSHSKLSTFKDGAKVLHTVFKYQR